MIKLNPKNRTFEMHATYIPINQKRTVVMVACVVLIRYRILKCQTLVKLKVMIVMNRNSIGLIHLLKPLLIIVANWWLV